MKVEGVLNEITGNSLKARSKEDSSIGLLIYASNEPKSVLARDLGDCRDNLRNSRSVFLIVEIMLSRFCAFGKYFYLKII